MLRLIRSVKMLSRSRLEEGLRIKSAMRYQDQAITKVIQML
jgi:hypothetical protein